MPTSWQWSRHLASSVVYIAPAVSQAARRDAVWSRLAPLCGSDLLSDRLLPLLWRFLEAGVGPVRTAAAHAAAPMLRSLRYVRDRLYWDACQTSSTVA